MGLGFHICHNKLSTASCVSSVVLCVFYLFIYLFIYVFNFSKLLLVPSINSLSINIHWLKCIICGLLNLQKIKVSDKGYIENFYQIIHDEESTSTYFIIKLIGRWRY